MVPGGAQSGRNRLNKKDLKRFKSMLEESKRQLLVGGQLLRVDP